MKKIGPYIPHIALAFILVCTVVFCSVYSAMEGQVAHAASNLARDLRKIRKEYVGHHGEGAESLYPNISDTYETENFTQPLSDY